MATDNHYGPDFAAIKAAHPDAVRYHWSENAFNKLDSCWLVAYPIECGGGMGKKWISIYPYKQTV